MDTNIEKIPAFSTTSIGSVPFSNVDETMELLDRTVDIPAWPQMVKLSPWEDMLFGVLSGLPALKIDVDKHKVTAKLNDREDDLVNFYENFFSGDYSFLAPTKEGARGFYAQLDWAKKNPDFGKKYLKAQVIGPLTLGQSITIAGQKNLSNDPELFDAYVKAVGAKASFMAEEIRKLNRIPIIFFDEPGLSGYGSAFSTLKEETVLNSLNEAIAIVKDKGPALLGVHVCGNTDWGLLSKTNLDILNFDAYGYIEPFCLYPKQLKAFYDKGGYVAWGVVPTQEFNSDLTADFLAHHLYKFWQKLAAKGLDLEIIADRSIISSACGLGSLSESNSQAILEMMKPVSYSLKKMINANIRKMI